MKDIGIMILVNICLVAPLSIHYSWPFWVTLPMMFGLNILIAIWLRSKAEGKV